VKFLLRSGTAPHVAGMVSAAAGWGTAGSPCCSETPGADFLAPGRDRREALTESRALVRAELVEYLASPVILRFGHRSQEGNPYVKSPAGLVGNLAEHADAARVSELHDLPCGLETGLVRLGRLDDDRGEQGLPAPGRVAQPWPESRTAAHQA
jgi:hypothetical protein